MERILVTGGAGFIGSHTVDLLLDRGYRVRILDSLQERVHPHGKPAWVPAEAEFVCGDVADPAHLAPALSGCDGVFHLAAYQDYLPDFSRFIHTNTQSTALMFELAVAEPKKYPMQKFVFASSQSVAGEGKYRCRADAEVFWPGPRQLDQLRRGEWDIACPTCGAEAEPLLIDEETCNRPHTAYAISKYATELLAFNLGRRYGIATAGMRYTYVQGTRNSIYNPYSGVARRFGLRLRDGLAPTCYEDGRQLRDYVNVSDVARANLIALESNADAIAINVGGGRGVNVLEFARLMIDAASSSLEPEVTGEFRLGDTRHTISDLTRMRSLGWEPRIPVERSVREYLTWLEAQPHTMSYLLESERVMAERGVVQRAWLSDDRQSHIIHEE
jgi:dTDP-L-rhamnose 4-epimerase